MAAVNDVGSSQQMTEKTEASSKKNTLRAMMHAVMDIARFNFSHGSHEEHRGRVDMVKNLREELNIPVALLLDTKGPEIRTKLL